MTWEDFFLARQLLAEETVGQNVRNAQAAEDAAFRASKNAARRG